MNSRELFHVWANQGKASAKSGNVFFEGPTIYSYGYHFPLAKLITIEGKDYAITNPDGYSVTTSRHKSQAWQAIHGRACFGISPKVFPWGNISTLADLEKAVALQAEESAKNATYAKERKARQAREARERKKVEGRTFAESLEKWRSGELRTLPGNFSAPVALRLMADADRIETSRGAIVPVRAARLAWRLIRDGASDAAFDWGHYRGLTVTDAAVLIGCHVIPLPEIERIAAALGLTEAAA